MIEGRICRDETGEPFALAQSGDLDGLLVGKIRSDFDEQGFFERFAAQYPDDFPQTLDFLKIAQAGGVGRADVDHEIVSKSPELPKALQIVIRRLVKRRGLGFSEIDADRNFRPFACLVQAIQASGTRRLAPSLLNPILLTRAFWRG